MAGTFFPTIWGAKTLEQMREEMLKTQRIVNSVTDYTPYTNGATADAYNGPRIAAMTAVDLPASATVDPSKTNIQIPFTQKKGVVFSVSDIDQAQSNINLLDSYTKDAKRALLDSYDDFLAKLLVNSVKTANRLDFGTTTDVLTETHILNIVALLDAAGAPQEGRFLLVDPGHKKNLLAISNFISADKIPGTQAVKTGVVGEVYGLTVIMSNFVPKVNTDYTGGGVIDATANDNTVYPVIGYQSLAIGFGRQKEIGAASAPNALTPGNDVNVFTVYGGVKQYDDYIIQYSARADS